MGISNETGFGPFTFTFYPKHLVHPAVSLSGDGSRRSPLMQSLPFLPRFLDHSSEPSEKNNTMSRTVSSSMTDWRPCSEARAARHHHELDPGCLARGAAPAQLCCTSSSTLLLDYQDCTTWPVERSCQGCLVNTCCLGTRRTITPCLVPHRAKRLSGKGNPAGKTDQS